MRDRGEADRRARGAGRRDGRADSRGRRSVRGIRRPGALGGRSRLLPRKPGGRPAADDGSAGPARDGPTGGARAGAGHRATRPARGGPASRLPGRPRDGVAALVRPGRGFGRRGGGPAGGDRHRLPVSLRLHRPPLDLCDGRVHGRARPATSRGPASSRPRAPRLRRRRPSFPQAQGDIEGLLRRRPGRVRTPGSWSPRSSSATTGRRSARSSPGSREATRTGSR